MIVVDASVFTTMLLYADIRGRKARTVLGADTAWAAPEHWKAEVFSAIRGLALGKKVTVEQAERAVKRLPRLGVESVPLNFLLARMWDLRAAISGYDSAYVALAQARQLKLVLAMPSLLVLPPPTAALN